MSESAGRGILRDTAFTLVETSSRPNTGHQILCSSRVVDMATGSSGHQWMVRCHAQKRRNSSTIIPKPPPHVARHAMSPTAPADSRPPSAPCAQLVATGVRQVRELFGATLPKWSTRLGSPVKVAWEVDPAPRGADRDAPRARGRRFTCSTLVQPRLEGGRGMAKYTYFLRGARC